MAERNTVTSTLIHETASHRMHGRIGGGVGGAGHAVYSETHALHNAQQDITLITAKPEGGLPSEQYPFPTVGVDLPPHETNEELVQLLGQDTRMREIMMEKLAHHGVDITHFVTSIGLFLDLHADLGNVENKSRRTIIGRLHSPYYATMRKYNPTYHASPERIQQEDRALRELDGIIFSTMAEAQETARIAAKMPEVSLTEEQILQKVIVAGLGTEHDIFNPTRKEELRYHQLVTLFGQEIADTDPFVIGINGRIHPERKTYESIAACGDVLSQQPKDNIIVLVTGAAGKGTEGQEEEARILEYIKTLPSSIAQRIYMKGVIPYDQAFAAVNLAINTTPYETWGLYTIEAASAGNPLIVADNPVTRDVLGGHAYYLQTISTESLTSALHSMQENWNDTQEQALLAHQYVQRYTWERTAEQLIAEMKRITQS